MREVYEDGNWQQTAEWLHTHIPNMEFALAQESTAVCTVSLPNDRKAEKFYYLFNVIEKLFGGHITVPMGMGHSEGDPDSCLSFYFTKKQHIDNARGVFPLPDGLTPGREIEGKIEAIRGGF